MFDDDDLDLSPEVLCSISRRRARAALLASENADDAERTPAAAVMF